MTRSERREFRRQYGNTNPHAMRAEIERQNTARGIPMKLTRNVPQRRHTDRTPLVTKLGLTILILLFSAVSLEVLNRWEHRANRPQKTEFERTHGYSETWPTTRHWTHDQKPIRYWTEDLHTYDLFKHCTSALDPGPCLSYDGTLERPAVYGTGSAGSPLTTRHVPQ